MTEKRLVDYAPSPYLIPDVALTIDLRGEKTQVTSTLKISKREGERESVPLVLNGVELLLQSIAINGEVLSSEDYVLETETLTLNNPPTGNFTLTTTVEIDPKSNQSLEGLYQSSGLYCTQCEAEGFRKITYFLDRPDILSTFTTTLIGNQTSTPMMIAGGNLVASEEIGADHSKTYRIDYPMPCYLFALVAGDLETISDTFTTKSGRNVAIHFHTEQGIGKQCEYALGALKRSMAFDEAYYDLEYDLDTYHVVAVYDFNMGAMENKGLNIFNAQYVLADEKLATDRDFYQVESVIGHEYFHNWTGNRVTCRDWFQLSLKEGLTVYRDQTFSGHLHSKTIQRIDDVKVLIAHQFREDAGPQSHPVRPQIVKEMNNFYTATVYNKGAEVVRMLETLVGEPAFKAGLKNYLEKYDGMAVTCEDFARSILQAGDKLADFEQWLHWYNVAGTPTLHVKTDYDEDLREAKLTIEQSLDADKNAQAFIMPIKLAWVSHDAPYHVTHEQTVILREKSTLVVLQDVEKGIPSLLRDFSAPVILKADLSLDDYAHLYQFDNNGFNRWYAKEQFCLQLIQNLLNDKSALNDKCKVTEAASKISDLFTRHISSIDSLDDRDLSLDAELLTLPENATILQGVNKADTRALDSLKNLIVQKISDEADTIFALYNRCHQLQNAPARALKNQLLQLLSLSDTAEIISAIQAQFTTATNMTDKLGALNAAIHLSHDVCTPMLEDFYHEYADYPLVIDKWMRLKASVKDTNIDQLLDLVKDKNYIQTNPNRVRAFWFPLTQNLSHFHDLEGRAYKKLAEEIVAIQINNPQLAARLVSIFNDWRDMAEPYSVLQKQSIEWIRAQKGLSKDVDELTLKQLG